MAYMLLIIEPIGQRATRSLEEGREAYAQMVRFGEELKAHGKLLAVESLASTKKAVRVQRQAGRTQVVDGPFSEAKEMVGGFFLVDCATREEAVELAARCPASEWCTVEVRSTAPCFEDAL